MRMSDIAVGHNDLGAPQLSCSGAVGERLQQLGPHRCWCSLSHAAGVAMATVIIEAVPT